MDKDSILRPSREKLNKVKMKFAHEQLNKAILFFLIVILPIIAIDMAGKQDMIPVPEVLMKILEGIIVVLLSFGGATLFIRLTINFITDRLEGIGQQEERILLSKLYLIMTALCASHIRRESSNRFTGICTGFSCRFLAHGNRHGKRCAVLRINSYRFCLCYP
jgi:hypothetical protein